MTARRFGPWMSLDEALRAAPRGPGVFQVRTEGVRAYPRGRSAMAHYGSGEDVRAAIEACDLARTDPTLRVRFMTELGDRHHTEVLEALLTRFLDRFGAAPTLDP